MTFILLIHAITCILLVLAVLMQAGRGGGLTESFSSAENVFGAQTSEFLVRATSILAAVFFTTSLVLAILSAHQERSLMAGQKRLPAAQKAASKKLTTDSMNEAAKAAAIMNVQLPVEGTAVAPKTEEQPAAAPAAAQQ